MGVMFVTEEKYCGNEIKHILSAMVLMHSLSLPLLSLSFWELSRFKICLLTLGFLLQDPGNLGTLLRSMVAFNWVMD